MAWALFLLFAAGIALALGALPLTGMIDADERRAIIGICLGSLGVCGLIASRWRALPEWSFQLLLAGGTVVTSAGSFVISELPADVEMFYIWVALFSAYFFSLPAVAAQIGFVGVCYAVVLAFDASTGNEAGRWLVTIGTLSAAALLFSRVSEELRRRLGARERSEAELERSLSLLEATLESTADGILVVDKHGEIVSFNRTFQKMWRIPDEVVVARDDAAALECARAQLTDPDQFMRKVRQLYDHPEAESYDVLQFSDGQVFERYSRPQRGPDGRIHGRVWSFRDVTERERDQSRLRRLAECDSLTGLLNRGSFARELARHVSDRRRDDACGALLLLDLDDFKVVNDSLGHRTGDVLLRGISELLRERLREGDLLARLGGDEFAILLPQARREQALHVAEDLLGQVRRHRTVFRGHRVRVTTSIGLVMVGARGERDVEELLVDADVAMYAAKEAGRDRVRVHEGPPTPRDHREIARGWPERIRAAIDERRLVLFEQPILDLRSGRVSQHELLVRMIGEDGELLPPGAFLPSAERSGLIEEIDAWVTRSAIRLLASRERDGITLPLEVNLSGRTLGDSTLPEMVERELAIAAVDPQNLIFEVTETAAAVNLDEARAFATALTALGCRFALDDFGAGFGSFYYLKYLPLDYLKIDGDFIGELADNPTDQSVVRMIVDLSHRLGMQTIAEFVGDEATLGLLRDYGVDYAQGFHLGKPTPVGERAPSVVPG